MLKANNEELDKQNVFPLRTLNLGMVRAELGDAHENASLKNTVTFIVALFIYAKHKRMLKAKKWMTFGSIYFQFAPRPPSSENAQIF